MTAAALILTITILLALTTVQMLLLAGVPIGQYAWGGKDRILPPRLRVAAVVAILLYAAFASLLASRVGVLPGGDSSPVVIATWILFAYSALSIIPNLASKSRPERAVQTPVSVALSLGILVIAIGASA
jgi:hypothetical protein